MESTRPLSSLKPGESGLVSHLKVEQSSDLQRLLSLGIAPGTSVEVVQKFPTFVVQANHSQLAFDEEIAKCIFVTP